MSSLDRASAPSQAVIGFLGYLPNSRLRGLFASESSQGNGCVLDGWTSLRRRAFAGVFRVRSFVCVLRSNRLCGFLPSSRNSSSTSTWVVSAARTRSSVIAFGFWDRARYAFPFTGIILTREERYLVLRFLRGAVFVKGCVIVGGCRRSPVWPAGEASCRVLPRSTCFSFWRFRLPAALFHRKLSTVTIGVGVGEPLDSRVPGGG